MAEPLRVAPGVLVPADALAVSAVRSSGPGGQNVNKVSSKIELRVEIARIEGLKDAARERLRVKAAYRLLPGDVLAVASQRTRDQHRNLEDARAKLAELIASAIPEPRPRRPTRPTAGSREKRLTEKKRRAGTKQGRRAGGWD